MEASRKKYFISCFQFTCKNQKRIAPCAIQESVDILWYGVENLSVQRSQRFYYSAPLSSQPSKLTRYIQFLGPR